MATIPQNVLDLIQKAEDDKAAAQQAAARLAESQRQAAADADASAQASQAAHDSSKAALDALVAELTGGGPTPPMPPAPQSRR